MSDYIESIFKGVDILIDKKLENLAYDTTIICTIVDDKDKKNGTYRVTDGSVTYIAYSDKDNYREGEQVRVNIPQGDYTQKKFIIGKYAVDENASPITYVSPLDSVVNISGNLLTPILGAREYGILANGTIKKKILWNQKLSPNQFRDLKSDGIYNTLIVKADFKTLLYNQNYTMGTYGLRIDLLVRPSPDSQVKLKRTVELTSEEMFGNPYNFTIFSPQAKTFSIVTAGIVEGIELSLFQNSNFTNLKGEYIKPPVGMADNIIIKNIELGFGSNLLDVEDNVVKIYCENGLNYKYNPNTEETNQKKIGLVWYNKDENNKYLGFSDGVYDGIYDEIAYLVKSSIDTRLSAQKGRQNIPEDETSLNLAANIEEAVPILYKISSMLTQDLCSELNYFKNQASGDTALNNKIQEIITSLTEIARDMRDDGKSKLIKNLEASYLTSLKYLYDNIHKKEDEEVEDIAIITNYFQNIINRMNNKDSDEDEDASLEKCLDWVLSSIEKVSPSRGYQEIRDNYLIRIGRVIDKIYSVIKTLPADMDASISDGNDFTKLQEYKSNISGKIQNYTPYAEQDFSEDSNKYCIYWYRYEDGYVAPSTEYKLMPDGWRRLSNEELKNPITGDDYNGLPSKKVDNQNKPILNDSGKETYNSQIQGDSGFIYPYLNPKSKTEKFVAIVFYDHAMYQSNELVFINEDADKIPDEVTMDKSDSLRFEHLSKSSESYLIYNDIYTLRDMADSEYEREIRCHYDGLLAKEDALVKAGIYWYVPTNSSMLTYDKDFLLSKGFDTDEGTTMHYSKSGYVCFYKQILKVLRATDINVNNQMEAWGFEFAEGENAYDDRSFWYKIKSNYEPSASQNHILCRVVPGGDIDGVEKGEYFTFGVAGTNGTKFTLAIANDIWSSTLSPNKLSGLILNPILKNADNATVDFKDGDPEASWYMFNLKESDGRPVIDVTDGEITIPCPINESGLSCAGCGILEISADVNIVFESDEKSKTRLAELQYLYAIPWCGAGGYYISGPTHIIYNNFGTLDKNSMVDTPYKLFRRDTHEEVIDLEWEIVYYKKDAPTKEEEDYEGLTISRLDHDIDKAYVPELNDSGGLTPSSLYLENFDYVPVVRCKKQGVVLFMQPIIITQNRYPSPLLNNWDGKFQIDEDNGTIMSTMLGAGRKNIDNSFDGVLMGNIATEAEGFKKGFGLYGFNKGAQSFGLNIDGTAFFGKAGRGRIEIDGDKGTISSASYQENKTQAKKAGMLIDLDDGYIDILGTSKNGDNYSAAAKQSHIKISSISPYLKIDSEDGNTLINIGTGTNGYYLQSNNYNTSTENGSSPSGMKIDLNNGRIDSYNFKLTSRNVKINSANGSTYFEIFTSGGEDGTPISLMQVANNTYYLQSANYSSSSNPSGMNINLSNGKITAHNFELNAGTTATGRIILNNNPSVGSHYFYIGRNESTATWDDPEKQYISFTKDGSLNIITEDFSLVNGELTARGGTIANWTISGSKLYCGGTDGTKPICIQAPSSATSTVFAVGGTHTNYQDDSSRVFYVNASGYLYAKNAHIEGHIEASSGSFKGTIYAGAGGTIGGWTINGSSISKGNTKLSASEANGSFESGSIKGSTITGGSISIGPSGGNPYFSVSTNSRVQMSTSDGGFLTLGTTTHPYVSALNLSYHSGGIQFYSGQYASSVGSSMDCSVNSSPEGSLLLTSKPNTDIFFTTHQIRISDGIGSRTGKSGTVTLITSNFELVTLEIYKGFITGITT